MTDEEMREKKPEGEEVKELEYSEGNGRGKSGLKKKGRKKYTSS